jgi:hypothetical protein
VRADADVAVAVQRHHALCCAWYRDSAPSAQMATLLACQAGAGKSEARLLLACHPASY